MSSVGSVANPWANDVKSVYKRFPHVKGSQLESLIDSIYFEPVTEPHNPDASVPLFQTGLDVLADECNSVSS